LQPNKHLLVCVAEVIQQGDCVASLHQAQRGVGTCAANPTAALTTRPLTKKCSLCLAAHLCTPGLL
jgi:hypothetical protein